MKSEQNEIWKPCPGFELWYDVSNMGNIRSYQFKGSGMKRRIEPVLMKPCIEKYVMANLSRGVGRGKYKREAVHILVAKAFIPNPLSLKWVHHKNDDKLDPRAENLEWVSPGQNQKYAYKSGVRGRLNGESNGRSKLSKEQVIEIFKSAKNVYEIAANYGVTKTAVNNIRNGRSWSSVTRLTYKSKNHTKLTKAQILEIYNSSKTQKKLAKKYGISQAKVSSIKTGRSYSLVTKHKFMGKSHYQYHGILVTHGSLKQTG